MNQNTTIGLFGTKKQTDLLLTLFILEESYARELAQVTATPLFSVQRYFEKLERLGIVATRLIGKERRITLSPRYFALKELKAFLSKLLEANPQIEELAASIRRRPRAKGKAL